MSSVRKAFVILTPAMSISADDKWLPFQNSFVRTLKRLHPELQVVVLVFHFPVVTTTRSTIDGAEVIAFGARMRGKLHSPVLWSRVWRALGRIRRKYDVIGLLSMFCSECAFVGHYYSSIHRLPHKIWILGQDARRNNIQVGRIRPSADELVAISDFLVREFRESHGITPAHLIPIGIAPGDFPEAGGQREFHLIGAGSLSALKHYDVFVDLVAELRAKIPDLRTVLCGDGPEEASLRKRIADLGLEEHILLITDANRNKVLTLMQHSRILLHPSSYEGFGLVCTEALYAGAQVISFVQPIDNAIPGWHIAGDKAGMAEIALGLLRQDPLPAEPKLPFPMDDTVRKMMRLFRYPEI